jgi:hypothetical protein
MKRSPRRLFQRRRFILFVFRVPLTPLPPAPHAFLNFLALHIHEPNEPRDVSRCGALSLLQKPLHYMEVQQNSCPGLNGKFIDLRIACAVRRVLPLPGFEVSSADSLNS